ncbi:hypothetical protein CGK10_24060 [Vibrio parahaemolyticus]|nr:hypothetical protein CGK10_24060 [Vibrio parahaemolyticus]
MATSQHEHNKAFKSDSQRLAVSLRSSIAKRRSHLNAALGFSAGNIEYKDFGSWIMKRSYNSRTKN